MAAPIRSVTPALVAGIHVVLSALKQDVDGGDKPGHDDFKRTGSQRLNLLAPETAAGVTFRRFPLP
jgi:hypothetical protein